MTKLREATIKFIDSYECDWAYYVTLTFTDSFYGYKSRDSIIECVEKEFQCFARRLKNELLGNKSKRIFEMIPVLEFGSSGGLPHYHVLMAGNDKYDSYGTKKLIIDLWGERYHTSKKYMQNKKNHKWFQRIKKGTEISITKYNTKTVFNDTSMINFDYIYPEKMRNALKRRIGYIEFEQDKLLNNKNMPPEEYNFKRKKLMAEFMLL